LIPSFFKYYIFIDSIPYVNILYGWLKQTQMLCFRLVSLISCLAATINPILEKFTGHKFNINSCDKEMLLLVADAVGVAVAAIVLVWFLSMVVFSGRWLRWLFGFFGRWLRWFSELGRQWRLQGGAIAF